MKKALEDLMLLTLQEDDINEIVSAFSMISWDKPKEIYQKYLNE